MNKNIENVLATLDDFRTNDEMTYSAYSTLHDEISLLDDLLKAQEEEISKLRWFIQEPHTATEAWNAYMERRHGGKWDDC